MHPVASATPALNQAVPQASRSLPTATVPVPGLVSTRLPQPPPCRSFRVCQTPISGAGGKTLAMNALRVSTARALTVQVRSGLVVAFLRLHASAVLVKQTQETLNVMISTTGITTGHRQMR